MAQDKRFCQTLIPVFSIDLHDTFIQTLHTTLNKFTEVPLSYLYGRTGHGARFSLAMNTKTGREIGHPSAHYSWDIVAVVEHCFPDCGIDCTLYIGPGYATRARSTAAQSDRELPENVVLLDYTPNSSIEFKSNNIIYPDHQGKWHVTDSLDTVEIDYEQLPFGPVFIDIHGFTLQHGFPARTLQYLVDTLERGEEPMEIRGRNNYSTVSGWKAFARWMQSFAVPLPGVKHGELDTQALLLVERRAYFLQFLQNLIPDLNQQERPIIEGLVTKYEHTLQTFVTEFTTAEYTSPEQVIKTTIERADPITLTQVRTCYFAEQKTLTYYKKLAVHLAQFVE